METLIEHLKKHKPKAFKPRPIYSAEGDSLTFIFEDVEYRRDRIDDFLTVYRATADGHLVGCQLKGVPEVLKLLGAFDLTINNAPVRLTMIFLGCMTQAHKDVQHFYLDLAKHDATRKAQILLRNLEAVNA